MFKYWGSTGDIAGLLVGFIVSIYYWPLDAAIAGAIITILLVSLIRKALE